MQITLKDIGSGELYLKIMKAICGDTEGKSMVDLGCCKSPYNSQLGFSERTYVDIQTRPLDNVDEQKYFIEMDMIEFLKTGVWFDVAISSDSLEHLNKKDGLEFVELMKKNSSKQIIFTPLGSYMVSEDIHPDGHRSGWKPDCFEGWASVVIPNFHPQMNLGAFFCWDCIDIQEDFERVKKELL